MEQQFELIAKTFQGLEEVLATELTELGADNISIGRRMVSFTGDQEMMYRANFCLRTAIRVLKPIKHFKAKDADEVYAAVKEINWSDYLDLSNTFSVDSVIFSQEFRHSKFVAYKVKDAIVDYFRETTGKRPNIGITNPDIRLNIHIADTDCTSRSTPAARACTCAATAPAASRPPSTKCWPPDSSSSRAGILTAT